MTFIASSRLHNQSLPDALTKLRIVQEGNIVYLLSEFLISVTFFLDLFLNRWFIVEDWFITM
jgi:hypothetical protein